MTLIDDILFFLKDGKWHNKEEITEKMELPENKTAIALEFLREYNFIKLSKNGTNAKLQPSTKKFIVKILMCEQEDSLNHHAS